MTEGAITASLTPADRLSPEERAELQRCEAIVGGLRDAFVSAGLALTLIKERNLFRETHRTWEDYVESHWQITRQRAQQLMAVVPLSARLSTVVDVLGNHLPAPANERQARAIGAVPEEQQEDVWREAHRTAPDGKITAEHIKHVANEMAGDPMDDEDNRAAAVFAATTRKRTEEGDLVEPDRAVEAINRQAQRLAKGAATVPLMSSESNDWYTPLEEVEAVREVLGAIDLDPASCEAANRVVKAATFYGQRVDGFVDGLAQRWQGRVYTNPPFGTDDEGRSNALRWSTKLIEEYEAGNVTEAIILLNAFTDRDWFHQLAVRFTFCLTEGRVGFYRPSKETDAPSKIDAHGMVKPGAERHGQVFFYLGSRTERFAQVFRRFGTIARQWDVASDLDAAPFAADAAA